MRYIGYRVVSKVPSEDIQTITWSLENHVSQNALALWLIRHCHWLIHEQYFECVYLRLSLLDFHQSKLSFLWKSNPNSFSISDLAIDRLVHASNILQSRQRFDEAFHSQVHLNYQVIFSFQRKISQKCQFKNRRSWAELDGQKISTLNFCQFDESMKWIISERIQTIICRIGRSFVKLDGHLSS